MVPGVLLNILYIMPFFFFFFFFLPVHISCRIPAPRPGIEPMPLALELWSSNHWRAREVSIIPFMFPHFTVETESSFWPKTYMWFFRPKQRQLQMLYVAGVLVCIWLPNPGTLIQRPPSYLGPSSGASPEIRGRRRDPWTQFPPLRFSPFPLLAFPLSLPLLPGP